MTKMTTLGYLFLLTLGYVITLCKAEYCWYDNYRYYINCPYSSCCGTNSYRYCCNYTPAGTIVGAVLGSVIFIAIVVSIVACCFCACCPGYRYRNQGTIITTQPGPNYQTMPNTPYQGNTGPYPPQNTGPYTAKPAGYVDPPPSYQV